MMAFSRTLCQVLSFLLISFSERSAKMFSDKGIIRVHKWLNCKQICFIATLVALHFTLSVTRWVTGQSFNTSVASTLVSLFFFHLLVIHRKEGNTWCFVPLPHSKYYYRCILLLQDCQLFWSRAPHACPHHCQGGQVKFFGFDIVNIFCRLFTSNLFILISLCNPIWTRSFSEHSQYSFTFRWIIGKDGDQGKVIFPESFDGIIATEVIKQSWFLAVLLCC